MLYRQCMNIYDILDDSTFDIRKVLKLFPEKTINKLEHKRLTHNGNSTEFLRVIIPGSKGKIKNGLAPTIGLIGRLGGVGARPMIKGFVSDGDGALAVLAAGIKIAEMNLTSDCLKGDVCICTHVCTHAPIINHKPVALMSSPIADEEIGSLETEYPADAFLSVDTSKGNRICNYKGFAITPTVKQGYILKPSDDLLDLYSVASGKLPVVFPITMQDITPYGNHVTHVNSIMQPCVYTDAPVVGVAITTETPVPGCATGASHLEDVEMAARYVVEVAKKFTSQEISFFDEEEFSRVRKLYNGISLRRMEDGFDE